MYYSREIEKEVLKSIANNPVTAITGPRQCGKSTLAKHIAELSGKDTLYLDLEKPSDLSKLDDPEWFLGLQKEKLICLDEIQRKPELFPLLRSLVDEWAGNGHFLVLGSASRELLRQSSESLAGRISYKRLTPFLLSELNNEIQLPDYLSRGGFPRSVLARDNEQSLRWREDFISTFLERDLLLWSGFSPVTMRKLWQMLAHLNGQVVNFSLLGSSLGVSHTTVRNYVELLQSTFMLHLLQPIASGTGKRLVKSPKVYLSDTGINNALLKIADFEQLAGHPSFGTAWETTVLNNLTGTFPHFNFYFYRTGHGAEIDIVVENGEKRIAVECKASLSPRLSAGTFIAIADVRPLVCLVVTPAEKGWPMKDGVEVVSIGEAIRKIRDLLSM
ncbi:MAG TPA: ATP-binding protein [Bacteroidales bacterium]|nr:ATP-binding protein [Bacteroidales bacterium]HPI87385.1 ATP-binding protein [Bacteroidales bacterium]